MNDYLTTLRNLAKQKHLIPAEQIILNALQQFEDTIPKRLSDVDFSDVEGILLHLLQINQGNLSIQCSIRISNCLLHIYTSANPPKIWGLIGELSKAPLPSVLFAIGHIIEMVGKNSHSTIPGIVNVIISKINVLSNLASAFYVLHSCFKCDQQDLSQYSLTVFDTFVMKSLKTTDEVSFLLGIRLAITLLHAKSIPSKKHISFAQSAYSISTTPETSDEISYYVAKLASSQLSEFYSNHKANSSTNEWNIEEKDKNIDPNALNTILTNTFEIFLTFRSYFSFIFSHFLDLLDPNIIQLNLEPLFNFIRISFPSEIGQLISLFGPEVRKSLFERVAKEQPPSTWQLYLLQSLQYDANSIREIAALAFQLSSSEDASDEIAGANFFTRLTFVDPHHAALYLETACLYLAKPPDDNPTHVKDFWGFAMIAIHILGGLCTTTTIQQNSTATNKQNIERLNDLVEANSEYISLFLNRALQSDTVFNVEYYSAFWLMAVLPEHFLPIPQVTQALSLFLSFLEENTSEVSEQVNNNPNLVIRIASCISLFLSNHPSLKIDSIPLIYVKFATLPFIQSSTSDLAIFIGAPYSLPQSDQLMEIMVYLIKKFSRIQPPTAFLRSICILPMQPPGSTEFSYLKPYVFTKPNNDVVFCSISPFYYPYYIYKYFPAFISSLPQESIPEVISSLFQLSFYHISHYLILSLAQNQYTSFLLPANLDELLLQTIELGVNLVSDIYYNKPDVSELFCPDKNGYENDFHVARLQVTAEALAAWGRSHQAGVDRIFTYIEKWRNSFKCLLYAAFATNHCFDGNSERLIVVLQDLDDLALNTACTPYALFALSTVLSYYTTQLAAMNIVDFQFPIFSNLIHSWKNLRPYELSFLSTTLTNILAVLSPEIQSDYQPNLNNNNNNQTNNNQTNNNQTDNNNTNNNNNESNDDDTNNQSNNNDSNDATNQKRSTVNDKDRTKFKNMANELKLLISSFGLLPMKHTQPAMYLMMRAVFAFARQLADDSIKSLQFPAKKGNSLSLKLDACGAFSDMLRVLPISNDYFEIVPSVLIILQRSQDNRASEFIQSIANVFTTSSLTSIQNTLNTTTTTNNNNNNNVVNTNSSAGDVFKGVELLETIKEKLNEWVKIVKVVLTNNSLPKTGTTTIEASSRVKICCLNVINILLPLHSKLMECQEPVGEILDDIMTSVTRGIETKRNDIVKSAYQDLEHILLLYKDRKTESGSRILELYDSQFTIAVRIGFQTDLAISGAFLRSYLKFHYDNLTKNPEEFETVLSSYVKGLSNCRQRAEAFFALASHICIIAKKNQIVQEQINIFAATIIEPMGVIVRKAMNLWTMDPPDWNKISIFRSGYESFFRDLLSTFIWLQSKYSKVVIEPDVLTKFVVNEIYHSTEKWRVLAAFDGLASIFSEYASSKKHSLNQTLTDNDNNENGNNEIGNNNKENENNNKENENNNKENENNNKENENNEIETNNKENENNNDKTTEIEDIDSENGSGKDIQTKRSVIDEQIEKVEQLEKGKQNSGGLKENNSISIITDSDVKNALDAVSKFNHLSPQLLSAALPPFILSCSEIISPEGCDKDTWIQLINFSLEAFNPQALAYLILKDSNNNNLSSDDYQVFNDIFNSLLSNLSQKSLLVDEPQAQSITLLLTQSHPEKAYDMINALFSSSISDFKLFFSILRRILLFTQLSEQKDQNESAQLTKVSKLGWRYFKNGGMQFFSYIFEKRPDIGFVLFGIDNLTTLRALCKTDLINTAVYIQFAHFAFIQYQKIGQSYKVQSFISDLFNLSSKETVIMAIEAIDKWGKDHLKGSEIIFAGVSLLNALNMLDREILQRGFSESPQRQQQVIVQLLEKQVERNKTQRKAPKLATFSTNRRRVDNEDAEWECLDISD